MIRQSAQGTEALIADLTISRSHPKIIKSDKGDLLVEVFGFRPRWILPESESE
jgi:hypothetical protein